jgi:hypothetical protein
MKYMTFEETDACVPLIAQLIEPIVTRRKHKRRVVHLGKNGGVVYHSDSASA